MNSQRTRDIGEVWEDPKCKGFSPVVLGCTPLPAHAHQPGTSLHPPSIGIYGSFIVMACSIIDSIFSPSPLSGG